MSDTETLSKLYLELANVLPLETKSSRELALLKQVDTYGLALMMIEHGGADPRDIAATALRKFGKP